MRAAEVPVQVDGGTIVGPGEGILLLWGQKGAPESAVALGAGVTHRHDHVFGIVDLSPGYDHIDVVVFAFGEAAVKRERQRRTLEGDEGDRSVG